MWEKRLDIVAQAVVEVCQHNPKQTWALFKECRDKFYILPSPLRNLLIRNFLFGKEKDNFTVGSRYVFDTFFTYYSILDLRNYFTFSNFSISDVEHVWRERFFKTVHQMTVDLKVERAIKSSVWKQIDTAVIEVSAWTLIRD